MTKRRIVISEYDNIAAIMEDDKAVEFIIHRGDMLLGDVYLAQVENILPSIDAAFVNVGGDKMGFLHSSDVPGKGDLKERLQPKQQLVVQIMKEPTGHKGPRVSTNISLPGRFLVMMPESKGISISRKIMETAERSRLKSIVSLVKPPGVGVIIRTEAEGQKESDLTEDFETLIERWQNVVSMADTATPPTLLYRDQDLLYRVIRESVTEDIDEIVVDSAFGAQRAQQLLQNWNLDKNIRVSQYQGSQPVLLGTGVDKEIKQALQTKVPLPSGGYLYIQPTEALTVIDVNSGKFTSLASQAETIKLTNLEACKEIARQLRLRNIGGMIIVDFIDMESRANQLQVLQTFENELAPDKAKPQIGQLSDLGLVEMTRHRQGQSLSEIFTKRCQHCSGTGHSPEEFTWMHNNMDPDNRGAGRQGGRNKLPLRMQRQQQLPKPTASVSKQQQAKRIAAETITGDRRERGERPHAEPGSLLLTKVSGRKDAPEGSELVEYFSDLILKQLGIKLSLVAKLSHMPMGINNILSRINPKANDVVTLVHSIEAAANMPVQFTVASDEDEEEGDEMETEEEEQPVRAERGGRPGRRDARGFNREDRHAMRAAAIEAVEEDDEVEMEQPDEFQVEVAEHLEEMEDEQPRRAGRSFKRDEEALEPIDDEELISPPVSEDESGVDVLDDESDTDEDDDDEPDEHDDEGAPDEAELKTASNPRGGGKNQRPRRGGRPAKRSVRKVPSKT